MSETFWICKTCNKFNSLGFSLGFSTECYSCRNYPTDNEITCPYYLCSDDEYSEEKLNDIEKQ
jgi:hypothetical protein